MLNTQYTSQNSVGTQIQIDTNQIDDKTQIQNTNAKQKCMTLLQENVAQRKSVF